MEGPAIKSPKISDEEISDEKKHYARTKGDQRSDLPNNSSTNPIDSKLKIDLKNKNNHDIVETFSNDEASRSTIDETIDCVLTNKILPLQNQPTNSPNSKESSEDLENSNDAGTALIKAKNMTKPLRSRAVSKKETIKNNQDKKKAGKSLPVKNTAQKVLAEKQIRSVRTGNEPVIFLRSRRKRGATLLSNNSSNSSASVTVQSKIPEICKNAESGLKNRSPDKENVSQESEKNSDPISLGNRIQAVVAKFRTRKTGSTENLSLMDKILNSKHERLGSIGNRIESARLTKEDEVLIKEQKSPINRNAYSMENFVVPKKRYHRRKCSEPMKNQGIETRQSRSTRLTLIANACEDCSRDQKTATCCDLESDEEREKDIRAEERAIICTPDGGTNDETGEMFSHGNQNLATSSAGKENNDESGNNEDRHALNFTKTKKHDTRSTASTYSKNIPIETDCSKAIPKYLQSSQKQVLEHPVGNLKRKPRHVNVQAMPIYMNRKAVAKNENALIGTEKISGMSGADYTDEKKEGFPKLCEKQAHIFLNNIAPRSKTDKVTDPKSSHLAHTDSEETLSNEESIPNSPAQDIWPQVAGWNLKFSDKSLKHRISKGVNLSVAERNQNAELISTSKCKHSEMEMNSSLNCGTKKDECELRYYIESSENRKPLCVSDDDERDAENVVGRDDLAGTEERPWLRHYERPQKTDATRAKNAAEFHDNGNQNLYHQQRKDIEATKRTSNKSIADNSASDNPIAADRTSRKQRNEVQQPATNPLLKKRGRPRKQDTEGSKMNSKKKKRSPAGMGGETNRPSPDEAASYGTSLTKLESDILFFKFTQHRNFGYSPEQPPIIIYNTDLYNKITARMGCSDPRKYYAHPHNVETGSNSESKTNPHFQQQLTSDNDCIRFGPPNNSDSGELGPAPRSMNLNSHHFSNELLGQTTYSKSSSPCSTHTYIPSNGNSFNETALANSVSNYMQSGYGTASNYHQNFYNNNANLMGNNSYFDSFSEILNVINPMNNVNSGKEAANLPSTSNNSDNEFNFIPNTPSQYQDSMLSREIDFTMRNGNNTSSNSSDCMQDSSSNNVNPAWNLSNVNQPLSSVNGLFMDANSFNNGNELSQTRNGSSDFNNLMNNPNSATTGQNPWMNRSNNMTNQFPVPPTWHGSSPMYNSYLNNSNSYYNMFNPYANFMGFDFSNYPYANMDGKNSMGMNNTNPWMQNNSPGFDGNSNTLDAMNSDFSNMNSVSLQENNVNQGMNLSLSSNTLLPQTNSIEAVNTDLGIGHGNGLNSNFERGEEDTFAGVGMEANNNNTQQSAQDVGEQLCLPYSLGYKDDLENLDFDDVNVVNTDGNNIENQGETILPEIPDYMNQRLDSFDECFNRNYQRTSLPNHENVADLPINREPEMAKLRQELVNFTRLYSDDQTSPISEVQQKTRAPLE